MKRIAIMAMALMICLLFTACGLPKFLFLPKETLSSHENGNTAVNSFVKQENGDTIYYKEFGSYIVPNRWEENEEHSTGDKFFYIAQGTDDGKNPPNNISVNCGTNRYAADEHEQFREAIMRQLTSQISGEEHTTLNGAGSYTAADYVLYVFTIREEDREITTTQYYIVGDYQYVLVHETTYGDSPETDEVAKGITDSFRWAK